MVQPPSRRDITGAPPRDPRNGPDLSPVVRHHGSYLQGLDPGFLGGRFSTPQLVPGGISPLVGGDGDGGSGDTDGSVIGEDGDRLVLTNLGTQVWALSYVPVSETLHVHWHPGDGAGVEWKRGEHYDLSEDDNIVTIYASSLLSGKAQIGDTFSAQYLRYEGEQEQVDPVEFKGSTSNEGTGSPPAGPLALPVETEIGDLVVITGAGVDVTDARFSLVGSSQTWVGAASNLNGIDYTNTGFHWAIAVAVFSPGDVGDTAWATGSSNPGYLPIVISQGVVIAGLTGSAGSLGTPSGFTLLVSRNQGVAFVNISLLHVDGVSPAAAFTAGSSWLAGVLTAPWGEVIT